MTPRPITHDWQPLFLEAFMTMGVHEAAKAAGVGMSYPFRARKIDSEFAEAWDAVRIQKFYERHTCETCGIEFLHSRSSGKPGRFCSEECKVEGQRAAGIASALDAFWVKVEKDGPIPPHAPELGACWVWTAAVDQSGYGMYRHKRSHRFSWEQWVGDIPGGLQVLHHCDNPPCVRPEHLFLGTLQENMADRNAKERQARGGRAGRARMTEDMVLEARHLRAQGMYTKDIAARFGVGESTITHVCTRRSWRHVA